MTQRNRWHNIWVKGSKTTKETWTSVVQKIGFFFLFKRYAKHCTIFSLCFLCIVPQPSWAIIFPSHYKMNGHGKLSGQRTTPQGNPAMPDPPRMSSVSLSDSVPWQNVVIGADCLFAQKEAARLQWQTVLIQLVVIFGVIGSYDVWCTTALRFQAFFPPY